MTYRDKKRDKTKTDEKVGDEKKMFFYIRHRLVNEFITSVSLYRSEAKWK